jgi:hypothetical protein
VQSATRFVHAVLWVGGALFILYFGDVWRVIKTDTRVIRYGAAAVVVQRTSNQAVLTALSVRLCACLCSPFFLLGCACIGVICVLFVYLMFVVPWIEPVPVQDFNVYSPNLILSAVIAGCIAFIRYHATTTTIISPQCSSSSVFGVFCCVCSFTIAFWPVWGWLTPVLVTVEFIASIMVPNLFPCC